MEATTELPLFNERDFVASPVFLMKDFFSHGSIEFRYPAGHRFGRWRTGVYSFGRDTSWGGNYLKGNACSGCGLACSVALVFYWDDISGAHGARPKPLFFGKRGHQHAQFTIDHLVPRCQGGSGSDNRRLMCRQCNCMKANFPGEDPHIWVMWRLLSMRDRIAQGASLNIASYERLRRNAGQLYGIQLPRIHSGDFCTEEVYNKIE